MTQESLVEKLKTYKSNLEYSKLAQLLTSSLRENSSKVNNQVFGYIPSLFREITINKSDEGINLSKIFIGEPVIYKIYFPSEFTIGNIPFFYLFCYLQDDCNELNVYFQSAAKMDIPLSQKDYSLNKEKVFFENIMSAFTDNISTICISDPGHFIPGLMSSFYVGTQELNFTKLISIVIESICSNVHVCLQNTLLFGSSAGAMGALLTSTYFDHKVQVLSINSQIYTHGLAKVMKTLLGTDDRQTLLDKFGDRVCCRHRFQKDISSVPNIYLLTNINDNLHNRNFDFYRLYQELFSGKNQGNQSVFDSYDGVEGHSRLDQASLMKKIKMARETLTMRSNLSSQLRSSSIKLNTEQVSRDKVNSKAINKLRQDSVNSTNIVQKESFDAYISLGDNCEAGIQFLRIGYKEGSFFRFTSSNFDTTFKILKNDFNDVFNLEYIIPRPGCEKMVFNKKYKIAFHSKLISKINQEGVQKFSSTYNFDEMFQDETNKINYLIDKWNRLMASEQKILFLLKNDSKHNYIDHNRANKLCNLLLNKYKNHNFQILCIQLDKFAEPQWDNPHLTNRYFPYFAPRFSAKQGCEAAWNKIFADFPLKT